MLLRVKEKARRNCDALLPVQLTKYLGVSAVARA